MPTPAANPKKIDQSTIPPAARRAAEEAERLRAEQYPEPQVTPQGDPGVPGIPGDPPPPPPPPPPVEAAGEPPAPVPTDPPAPQPSPSAEPGEDDESWKQKYESQLGRTRKLQKDVGNLSARIDELQTLLATVQAPAPAPAQDQPEIVELLTPEEKEEWGAVLPVMDKRFKELMPAHVHKLQSEIESLKSALQAQGQKGQQNARAALYQYMDTHPVLGTAAVDWKEINNDDDFVEWVKYPDVMSGRTRKSLLQEAYDTNDAPRFAAIFESFLREAGRYPAPAASRPNGNGSASHEPPVSGNGLERYAAPGPARTAPAPSGTPAAQEIFTTGDITRFYADKRLGKWKGREKEMEDYERRIFAASNSNRVRPGPPSP
jgi:hypothetical protein